MVGKLNRATGKLRGDFRERNDGRIAVRPVRRTARRTCSAGLIASVTPAAASKSHNKGPSPFILLFASVIKCRLSADDRRDSTLLLAEPIGDLRFQEGQFAEQPFALGLRVLPRRFDLQEREGCAFELTFEAPAAPAASRLRPRSRSIKAASAACA